MELNDLLSCGVWASRGQTWTPQRSRDLAAAWQFWTAHASGWVWVTGWKPGQWGRQSESFSTGGSLQNTHKHKPAMSVWWFNSKFNSIEESWTDLWRKWHGCSVKDARLKKTETETACIIKIMRKKKKKNQDGEEVAGFDTWVLASENMLPKGQRENTKWHILWTDYSPLTVSL